MPGFEYKTEQFNGPLDLLLSLIQERKLYINEISLASVTDSYLDYLEQCPELPVGETAQFVLVASTLLLIKSRSLLPNLELTTEEEEQIHDLETRLELYRIVKEAAKELGKLWGKKPLFFAKKAPESPQVFAPTADMTLPNIVAALEKLTANLPIHTFTPTAKVRPVISLQEMIVRLEDRITRASRIRWSALAQGADKEEKVVHFLALLELVRRGKILAEQHERFGDIMFESESVAVLHIG